MPIYPDTCDKCGHRWAFHGGPAGCAVQTGYGCDAELCGCQERLTEPRAPATGPVCQKCHVPMVDAESKDAGGVAYRCPQCGDLYDVGVPV
jgi:predicted nucleic acid-binding Zn ribbon protein